MKTHITVSQKTTSFKKLKRTLGLISIFIIAILASNPMYAQTDKASSKEDITVKGIVNDESGLLLEANISLKGSKIGTSSDKNGAFTFPKALKKNDVLVFTHLGYNTTEIKIDENSTFLEITLSSELIEVLGALEVDKPYKSKRSK